MLEQIFPSFYAIISLTAIGAIFGLILSIAKIKLHVEKDPRIEEVINCLPGANCGACGMPGCSAYATKIVEDKFDITLCPVGGEELIKDLAEVMGVEAVAGAVPLKARLHCHGGNKETINRFQYKGPLECSAADKISDGFKGCEYGCLGLGECVAACPFDAMYMDDNGLPVVIDDKCTGCGNCVEACPRDILSLVPQNFKMWVMCKNEEKGGAMKKHCSVGCIGCKLCEKACIEVQVRKHKRDDAPPAITVNNFIAKIDYDICINCMKCVQVCPVPVIHPLEKSKKFKDIAAKKKEAENSEGVVAEQV